jgi:hypothetical protein
MGTALVFHSIPRHSHGVGYAYAFALHRLASVFFPHGHFAVESVKSFYVVHYPNFKAGRSDNIYPYPLLVQPLHVMQEAILIPPQHPGPREKIPIADNGFHDWRQILRLFPERRDSREQYRAQQENKKLHHSFHDETSFVCSKSPKMTSADGNGAGPFPENRSRPFMNITHWA